MTDNQNEQITKEDLIGIDTITLRVPIKEVKFSKNYQDQLELKDSKLFLMRDEHSLFIKFKMNSIDLPYQIIGSDEFDEDTFEELLLQELKKSGVTLLTDLYLLEVGEVLLVKKIYLNDFYQDYEPLLNLLKLPGYRKSYIKTKHTFRFENQDCKIEITGSEIEREIGNDLISLGLYDDEYEEDALLVWIELKNMNPIGDYFNLSDASFYDFNEDLVGNIFKFYLKQLLSSIDQYDVNYFVSNFIEMNLNLIKPLNIEMFREQFDKAIRLIQVEDEISHHFLTGDYNYNDGSSLVEFVEMLKIVVSLFHANNAKFGSAKDGLGEWILTERIKMIKDLKSKFVKLPEEKEEFANLQV